MKIFMIGPVRNITTEEEKLIKKYVYDLKDAGHQVHWSVEDVDQNDPIGYRICSDNRRGMENCDEVHVWWNQTSQGSLFDLGMAFAMRKKIVFSNKESFERTLTKSFTNVLFQLDAE